MTSDQKVWSDDGTFGAYALHLAFYKFLDEYRLEKREGVRRRKVRGGEKAWCGHLVDLLGFEGVLEDLEICDELVFVLGVHLDPGHRHIA